MALIRTALALNTLVIDAMALLAGHGPGSFQEGCDCVRCGRAWPCPTRQWMDRAEALAFGR